MYVMLAGLIKHDLLEISFGGAVGDKLVIMDDQS